MAVARVGTRAADQKRHDQHGERHPQPAWHFEASLPCAYVRTTCAAIVTAAGGEMIAQLARLVSRLSAPAPEAPATLAATSRHGSAWPRGGGPSQSLSQWARAGGRTGWAGTPKAAKGASTTGRTGRPCRR